MSEKKSIELEYSKIRPEFFRPTSKLEGQTVVHKIITTCRLGWQATDQIIKSAARLINMVGIERASGADIRSIPQILEKDHAYFEAAMTGEIKGLGYLISSNPADWGVGNVQLAKTLDVLCGGTTGLLSLSNTPYNTGFEKTYFPKTLECIFMMMCNKGSTYVPSLLDYKSPDDYYKILGIIGCMESSYFAASFLWWHWVAQRAPFLRLLFNLEKKIVPVDVDITIDDESSTFIYAVRIDQQSKDLLGFNVADYEKSSFIKRFIYEMIPEGGVPVHPLAKRLGDFMTVDMKVPIDSFGNQCPWNLVLGPTGTDDQGRVNLNLDVSPTAYYQGGSALQASETGMEWHQVTISMRNLTQALRAFSDQRKGIKAFKRIEIPLDAIIVTEKDLLSNRAGVDESSKLQHILYNIMQLYEDGEPATQQQQLVAGDAFGIEDTEAQNVFHLSTQHTQYIVADIEESKWKDDWAEDLVYGILLFVTLLKHMCYGTCDDSSDQDTIHITRTHKFGSTRYDTWVSNIDENIEIFGASAGAWTKQNYFVWHLNSPAYDERYFFETIQAFNGNPNIVIVNENEIAILSVPYNGVVSGAQINYFTYGWNMPFAVNKNVLNVTRLMKWILKRGMFNFGSSSTPVTVSSATGKEPLIEGKPSQEIANVAK